MDNNQKEQINTLVQNIGMGDEKSFDVLYAMLHKDLFYFLKKYHYDEEHIKDVIVSTFMIIIEKSKTKMYYKNCYSWIFSIAKYQMFNLIRKNAKEKYYDDLQVDSNSTKENMSDSVALNIAINKLTKQQKLIFYLKFKNNLQYNEIAKIMKTSQSTIKRRIAEVRSCLKEFYNE